MYYIIIQQLRGGSGKLENEILSEFRNLISEEDALFWEYIVSNYNHIQWKCNSNSYYPLQIYLITESQSIKIMTQIYKTDMCLIKYDWARDPRLLLGDYLYHYCIDHRVHEYFKNHSNIFVRLKMQQTKFYSEDIVDKTLEFLNLTDIIDRQLAEYPECIQELITDYLIYFDDELVVPQKRYHLYMTNNSKNQKFHNLEISEFWEYVNIQVDSSYYSIIRKFLSVKNITESVNVYTS